MSQQAPKLVSDTHYCVVGDVSVDDSAAIAPGVVLQAASGSRIIISKGVCLAAGVCIQSRKGVLKIAAGASLGANVLVVGKGEVGADCCVSAGSTLVDPAVAAETILPPDTLVSSALNTDAASRTAQQNSAQNIGFQRNGYQENGHQTARAYGYSSFQMQHGTESVGVQSSYAQPENEQSTHQSNGSTSQLTVHSSYDRVYGREQVTKLISALFPNRQTPNG